MQKVLFFCFTFFIITWAKSQNNYPQDYFRSPMDTDIVLSGNFGEIRPNHFHAGFDIKTGNREGLTIYAVADGYISRIKISPYGYGKALYITHQNGYTSVYGHLSTFPERINNFIKNIQTQKQSFEIDTLIGSTNLLVKQGEIIAFSGNTGGSQGPHLHFEIRETQTEKPVNPYLFGYKIKDLEKPKITQVVLYPMDEYADINGKNTAKKITPILQNGKYTVKNTDSINASGKIGFAIECFDTETSSNNKNSVFSIELQSGGKRIYYCEFEKFSFENARYVNAHIDYVDYKKNNSKLQKCYLSKNNKVEIYKDIVDNGIINFNDDAAHWIKFIVKDFAGNASECIFKIQSKKQENKSFLSTYNKDVLLYDCTKENIFQNKEIEIVIPPFALYDDLKFSYAAITKANFKYAPLHSLQNTTVPLQKAIKLKLKAFNLPDSLQNKACIISVSAQGKINYEGGKYMDTYVSTEVKNFGNYTITTDVVPPKIAPLFKADEKGIVNFSGVKTIQFKVSDNLSGVKKYNLFIDNKWVIMEYEPKKELLFYVIESTIAKGSHTLKIEVVDDKENKTTREFSFIR
jgi:hypothetical protein